MACTSAGTVDSAGMIVVATPSPRAAAAVTGPMQATSTRRSRPAASAPIARAKFLTPDPLVNATTSTRASRSIRRTSGPSRSAGAVR